MKRFLPLFFALIALNVSAQKFYVFSSSTGTYQNLSNATVLTTDLSQSNYLLQLPPVFRMFGADLSANLVIGKNGFVVNTGSTNSFAFDPFLAGIQPIGTSSSISAKIEYTANDTILKVEWNNVTLNGLPSGNYLNFQAWLYKHSQVVEFHYGPSLIMVTPPNTAQPVINLSFLSIDFNTNLESHTITGTPQMPVDDTVANTQQTFNGVPTDGTIYRFTKNPALAVKDVKGLGIDISIYPNPADNKLFVDVADKRDYSYSIVDFKGAVITEGKIKGKTNIDVTPICNGLYQLILTDAAGNYSSKSFTITK